MSCTTTITALCPGLPRWAGTRRNIHPRTNLDHHPTFISFFHLLQSIASSQFNLCAWQSFCTTSLQVLFGLPLGLEPSTSYSIHFFTQSVSSFCNTCPYHRSLFCCSTKIILSIPSLSLNSSLGTLYFTLTLHIHLTILISAHWSSALFSFLTGQVSLQCSILHSESQKARHYNIVHNFTKCWPIFKLLSLTDSLVNLQQNPD